MHDFSASIARLSETSCGCGRGSKLSHSHFCHCMIWISPSKKLSGVFNYCWLPIHKRGFFTETHISIPSPTIHTLWRNNCTKQLLPISSRLAAPGELHSAAPCDHVTPVGLSTALPLTSQRPGHFAVLHVQINLCSASGQQFSFADLPRILWEVHEPWVWSSGTQWLVTGFSFRSWRGVIAPLRWLRGTV